MQNYARGFLKLAPSRLTSSESAKESRSFFLQMTSERPEAYHKNNEDDGIMPARENG
jgi:hypothetical protein